MKIFMRIIMITKNDDTKKKKTEDIYSRTNNICKIVPIVLSTFLCV